MLNYFPSYGLGMTWVERLQEKFDETGWTKAELSRRSAVEYDNVTKYIAGKVAQPRGDVLAKLAKALGIDPLWLEKGIDKDSPSRMVPLKGFIGAGHHVEALEYGPDEIDAPADSHPDTVAAEIRGDSQMPVLQDGWIIYWSLQQPAMAMINKLAVVQLADGRIMVKTLRNGSQPGFWTLTSPNAADIIDVPVDWAAKIDWIKPR
jgi:transcriptional regulator with XRE-family HTH domain